MRQLGIGAITAVLALVGAPGASAQPQWSDKTVLTFDGPVEVPGATLEAGAYQFRLVNSAANRQMVQIWNEDRTKLFTTTMAVPVKRLDTTGDVVVTFVSTAPGTPPAIKSWFYPGQVRGHQFVYPEEQARRIARTSKELVLSADRDADFSAPESIDSSRFAMIDEAGTRTPYAQYETEEPPRVAGAVGDREEGSGTVQVHGLEGEEAVKHHVSHILRLTGNALAEGAAGPGAADRTGANEAVGTSGESQPDTVTIPRAQLEEIRMHAQRAQNALERE